MDFWTAFKYWGLRIGGPIFLLLLVVSAFKSYAIVPVGHKGVVLNFGAAEPGGLDPGLHFITPYRTKVYNYHTQVQNLPKLESCWTRLEPMLGLMLKS
ncbi:MAG: SPFH domain-containing protein [Candidatus Thorarchaeota archaeon]|jgi:regulator of protease activity HflC (stomatin/prohibitin superfamily)